ncbi:uncharacterized protein LOC120201767 [Hibiscus syriacus]|uniref:uncharacterized protein LOC120201767 n=1 Tax=Hibiscus syriacus TaxID=106335 RepID=UPI0019220B9E|nr:uncharacterized protein LOC120201767 [Hibiscus syriacus]XP_039058236.1 uncharacterized protein LOC120201767 [Hibiscus syriacus]XP_039058237.1 uncharacterized protein LOC120201767 [Hibiscus syriacus]
MLFKSSSPGNDGFIQKLEYEKLNLICFECGRYGHYKEGCLVNSAVYMEASTVSQKDVEADPPAPSALPESEFYGPWMVVERRHRKQNYDILIKEKKVGETSKVVSSCFDVLQEVVEVDEPRSQANTTNEPKETATVSLVEDGRKEGDQEQLKAVQPRELNAAFLESNPNRKSKTQAVRVKGVTVVPMVEGQSVKVTDANSGRPSGAHKVISIVEKGHGTKSQIAAKLKKPQVSGNKVFKENSRRGGTCTKQLSVSKSKRTALSEWVHSVSNQLIQVGNKVGSDCSGLNKGSRGDSSSSCIPTNDTCVLDDHMDVAVDNGNRDAGRVPSA